jgi:AraC family transcriptional regulator
MDQAARERKAAEIVITLMQDRLSDPLLMDDLARAAHYSKFHFCRLFRKATGVTPGRFLSALRLKESRHLLLDTGFTVSDISCAVGYNSVGTFSSRFTRSIGISPSVFRRNRGFSLGPGYSRLTGAPDRADGGVAPLGSTLEGTLLAPPGCRPHPTMLVAFPTAIPEGRPLHYAMLARPGPWRLPFVGDGDWYVVAAAIAADEGDDADSPLFEEQARFVGRTGPLAVRAGQPLGPIELQVRPVRLSDPPILFAPLRHATSFCDADVRLRDVALTG